jgi:hypothetical protein
LRYFISLTLILLCLYFYTVKNEAKESSSTSQVNNPAQSDRIPANTDVSNVAPHTPQVERHVLAEVGLTTQQEERLYKLAEMHESMPVYNIKNIKEFNAQLLLIKKDKDNYIEAVVKIFQLPDYEDDHLNTFLLNTINKIGATPGEINKVVSARIVTKPIRFNEDGSLVDEDLSAAIALELMPKNESSCIQVNEWKKTLGTNYNEHYDNLFRDYFPSCF